MTPEADHPVTDDPARPVKSHTPKDLLIRFVIAAAGGTGVLYLVGVLFG